MRTMRAACSLLLVLALVVPLSGAAADEGRQVRITAAVANVRSGPAATAKVVFQLRAGETVRLVAASEQWYQIEASDGRRGYVFHRLGEVVEPPPPVAAPAPPPVAPVASVPKGSAGSAALAIQHDQIGCVVAGLYPKVDACLKPAESVGRGAIHFRASDGEPWYGVNLASDGPCYSAFLPKPQRTMTEFQYYVTAVDKSFSEYDQPETGPAAPYRVRVVHRDRDCGTVARLAYSAAKIAKPIVVAVVRDPAGRAMAAGALEGITAHALLAGFAQEGVVLAGSTAATAGTAGAAATGAGGGGAGGGIGVTTIAIAGGAVVAAAVVVKAASGGSSNSSGSGSGSNGGGGGTSPTPTPTPTPAPTLTGNWAGTETGTGRVTGSGADIVVNCTGTLSGPFQHTGTTLTGHLTYGKWACNPSDGLDFVPQESSSADLAGTASNGQITLMAPTIPGCPSSQVVGTYTSSTIDIMGTFQCNIEGLNVSSTELIHLVKQ
ncbi:MAG TPA: SH3 domain-containing protein [Vicinamibacteria bacterium]|nr:SH3 domain-containing protein [Vicinamibacteria bacterium]